jgi:hypothetical protein
VTAPPTAAGGGRVCPPAAVTVAGLDIATRHHRDADAVAVRLAGLLPPAWADRLVVATHVQPGTPAHVALSVEVPADADSAWSHLVAGVAGAGLAEPALASGERTLDPALASGERTLGPPEHVAHARAAAHAHAARSSGRAVVVPGVTGLPAALPVAELLERTAVERVAVLAGGDAPADALLLTRGFLRPRWSQGALVLHVQPAAGDVLVPFEVPDPTPCCADHP